MYWTELKRTTRISEAAASQILEDEGKVCSATILPPEAKKKKKIKMMWSDCEKTENAVSLTGSWLKSPFWITVVVVIVVISHQTSRKICTVVTRRRVGDMPCHPHQYSSAFLTSPSRRSATRGVHSRDSSIIIFIVVVVVVAIEVFIVSAVGFCSQVVPVPATRRSSQQNVYSAGANYSQPRILD